MIEHSESCGRCHRDPCACPERQASLYAEQLGLSVTGEPPAAPELPEGWTFSPAIGGAFVSQREDGGRYAMSITLLRALLATQGLHIVSEKDRAIFPELVGVDVVYLYEDNSGFVSEVSKEWADEVAEEQGEDY